MTYQGRLSSDGRSILVPAELAEELGLQPGEALSIEVAGRKATVTPEARDALTRLRRVLEGYSVDQFLAERNGDWRE